MTFRSLETADLAGKRVLVRVDFNVPMEGGVITDDTRLRSALPTIHFLSSRGAKVILLAHFDRPKGKRVPEMSLAPVVAPLSVLLGQPVLFGEDCIGEGAFRAVSALENGDVAVLENLRFHPARKPTTRPSSPSSGPSSATSMSTTPSPPPTAPTPRPRASPACCRPIRAWPCGGSWTRSTRRSASRSSRSRHRRRGQGLDQARPAQEPGRKLDRLAIGGGMANTFLAAQGHDVGGSLCEHDLGDTAREIMASAKAAGCELLLPVDVVVAREVKPGTATRTCGLDDVKAGDLILDAGPETVKRLLAAMDASKTLIWNGPLGVFEVPPFDMATVAAAKHAAALATAGKLTAVAGGGDTVSALNHAGVADDMTFVSTAGGAFLEWMEGKALPGVEALEA
jgi:phosphoglycerate kinase